MHEPIRLRLMDIVPIFILFVVSLLGCKSMLWHKLCLSVAISSFIYILAQLTVLPYSPESFPYNSDSFGVLLSFHYDEVIPSKYLGYFGAIMSIFFAGTVSSMSLSPPIIDDAKNIDYMLGCAVAISLLFIIQGFMNFTTQLYFNAEAPDTNWANTIFKQTMFIVAGLQIILLSRGGFDGTRQIFRNIKTSTQIRLGYIYSNQNTKEESDR